MGSTCLMQYLALLLLKSGNGQLHHRHTKLVDFSAILLQEEVKVTAQLEFSE